MKTRLPICATALALGFVLLASGCGDPGGVYKSEGGAQAGGQDVLPASPAAALVTKPPILVHRAILTDAMEMPDGWRYIGDSVNKDEYLSAQFSYRDDTGGRHYFDVTLELMSEVAGARSHMKVKRAALRSPSGDLSNTIPQLGYFGYYDSRQPSTVFFSRHNAFLTVRREGSGTGSATLAKMIDNRILGLLSGDIVVAEPGGVSVREVAPAEAPPGYIFY